MAFSLRLLWSFDSALKQQVAMAAGEKHQSQGYIVHWPPCYDVIAHDVSKKGRNNLWDWLWCVNLFPLPIKLYRRSLRWGLPFNLISAFNIGQWTEQRGISLNSVLLWNAPIRHGFPINFVENSQNPAILRRYKYTNTISVSEIDLYEKMGGI